MIEGKKISQLIETNKLNTACCFPVLSGGATKRITFAALVNNIIAALPEGMDEEEIKEIRKQLNEHEEEIQTLISNVESIENVLSQLTIKVNGQDRTILEYTSVVQELQRVYEQATISGGVVDSHLNADSINPVQNKVIAQLIPAQASTENKLADKEFVNSSIATNTAYFRGTFDSVDALEAYEGEKTNNDYAFVVSVDEHGNTKYSRYKWNNLSWVFEYDLNNSSFTAEQWAAINSGITEALVAQIRGMTNPYPIGSIYWTADKNFNPATNFGGTWERVKNKFIYAGGDNDEIGATGGSKKISVANLPSHSHGFTTGGMSGNATGHIGQRQWSNSYAYSLSKSGNMSYETKVAGTSTADVFRSDGAGYTSEWQQFIKIDVSHTHSGTTNTTGSGTDYMPPYEVAYCWKRTA